MLFGTNGLYIISIWYFLSLNSGCGSNKDAKIANKSTLEFSSLGTDSIEKASKPSISSQTLLR